MELENAFKALADVNASLVFGHFDVDTEYNNRVAFTNTIMCRDVEDIDSDEISFNINLGFNMAISFEEVMLGTGMLSSI